MKTKIQLKSDALPDLVLENADLRAALALSERAGVQRDIVNEELKHRIANLLTVVSAIARKTFRETDPAYVNDFTDRLAALAAAQSLLIDSETRSTTLDEVVRAALMAHLGRCSSSGPQVVLSGRQAHALTLALHELATNALKYGALSASNGCVTMRWTLEDGLLEFRWTESGGPPVATPTRRGVGSMLITQNLKSAFSGSVELAYDPGGVTCILRAPNLDAIH